MCCSCVGRRQSRNPVAKEPQASRNPELDRKPYSAEMKAETDIETTMLRIQETLDELFCERLIPFRLATRKVSRDGAGEYVIPFSDRRIQSIRFAWRNGESFKEAVRAAIVDSLERTSLRYDRLVA